MAARRPIVRSGGRNKQLPAGDVLLGIPLAAQAYQVSGALLRLPLSVSNTLPVAMAAGGTLNVVVMTNG